MATKALTKEPLLSDDDLITQFQEDKIDALDGSNYWRLRALESYRFYHVDQWDAGDLKILYDQQRPAITFNRIKPFVAVVVGTMIQNRGQPKYMARETSDRPRADIFQSAAAWAREISLAEYYETKAAKDMLICGIGCTDERVSYENGIIAGTIVKERIYPLQMYSDPRSHQMNRLDARFHFRAKHLSKREFIDQFDKDPSEVNAGSEDLTVLDRSYYDGERFMYHRGDYTVFQYQYRRKMPYFWAPNPLFSMESAMNRNPFDVDVGQMQMAQQQFGVYMGVPTSNAAEENVYRQFAQQFGKNLEEPVLTMLPDEYKILRTMLRESDIEMTARKNKAWRYFQAFISGQTVLDHGPGPLKDGFSFKFMTGDYDDENNCHYGLVEAMIDPAKYSNKAFSQHLHILNTQPKGGLIIERGATDNIAKLEKNYARNDSVIVVNDGALTKGKIKDKAQATQASGFEFVLTVAQGAFREVTGINLELLGQTNREQAGILEATRIQQGMTVLGEYLDSTRLYLKESGKATVQFMRELTDNVNGLLVRIVGSEEGKYERLFADDIAPYYDVIVGDAPASPNQDSEDFKALGESIRNGALQPTPAVQAALVEKAPIRQALKDKILEETKQASAAQQQQQQQMQQTAAQLEIADKQAGIQDKSASAFKKQQEAALTAAKAAKESQEVKARTITTGIQP